MASTEDVSSISKRAFLVGCPRSGTTLLQSMLMGHSRIASYPETHFFARGFGGRWRWVLHETLRGWYLWSLLVRWLVITEGFSPSTVTRVPVSWSKARMVDVFRRLLDRRTAEAGKDIWIEKTPGHLHFVDVIDDHMPSPVFIHLVRDGRAVVASMHQLAMSGAKQWSTYQSVDAAIHKWNRSVRVTLRHDSDDAHVTIGYESLVDTPETALRRIATVLGIQYDPRMVDRFHEEAKHVVKSHESWKERTTSSELKNQGLDKFHATFSDDEQAYIESQLDWVSYRALGYSPL